MSRRRETRGRLTEDALERFIDGNELWPSWDGFERWLKRVNQERDAKFPLAPREFFALVQGRAGRWRMVQAIATFISEHPKSFGNSSVQAIDIAAKLDDSAWRLGWEGLFSPIGKRFDQPDEAYCASDADFAEAAALGMRYAGRACTPGGESFDDKAALKAGELVMQRTPEEYAEWMHDLATKGRKKNPYATMFSTLPDGDGGLARVGMIHAVSSTQQSYARFRNGLIRDIDLRPSDLEMLSEQIVILHAAEVPTKEAKRAKDISARQVNLMTFAIAMQAAKVGYWHRKKIKAIGFAGSPEGAQRYKDFGAEAVGTKMPACGEHGVYDIYEIRDQPWRLSTLPRYAHYVAMLTMMHIIQTTLRDNR